MRKIVLIILSLFLSLGIFINKAQANEDWISNEDGYHYYNFPEWTENSNITIIVNEDEILEVQDHVNLIFNEVKVDGKTAKKINIQITYSSGWYEAYYKYYTLNNELIREYPAGSYAGLNYIDIQVRKLNNISDIPGDELVSINDLPLTVDSPDKYNMLGHISFNVDGKTLLVTLTYFGTYKFKVTFSNDTDMSIFDTVEAYYLNFSNKPQIIINHSDRQHLKDVLLFEEPPTFVPHSIWDLKTNEIKTVNSYDTNVYVKQNNRGVLIAYVFIDEYVMDNILSANISWYSRQKNDFPLSIVMGKYSPWEERNNLFLSDGYLSYKNFTMSWDLWIPGWQIIRGIYNLTKTYQMPSIESLDLNNIHYDYNVTTSELIQKFSAVNENFNNNLSNPLYKVWAFALEGGKSFGPVQTQIFSEDDTDDPEDLRLIQIIEIKYETNGKLYAAIGDEMDIKRSYGDDLTTAPDNDKSWFDIPTKEILAVVGFGFYGLVLYKNRGFKNMKNFIRSTIIFGVFILIGYLVIMNIF